MRGSGYCGPTGGPAPTPKPTLNPPTPIFPGRPGAVHRAAGRSRRALVGGRAAVTRIQFPARAITGPLVWTVSGTVWGFWVVPSYSYRYLGIRARQALAEATRAALLTAGSE